MKTLVIGASGYVGQAVTRTFRAAGHEVAGLARSEMAATTVSAAGASPVAGDLADPASLLPHLGGFDAIVFTPSIDPAMEQRAVSALLDGLAGSDNRFLFTSGTAVLAKRTEGHWIEDNYAEDDPFEDSAPGYGRVQTEETVRSAAARGIRTNVIRPPMIWGHGRCPPIAALHGSARTGAIRYIGPGLNVYSTIHVDDLADIFLRAATSGVPGALYHSVSGETNWRSLAEAIARLRGLPTRPVAFPEAEEVFGPFLAPIVFASNSRTRCPRTRRDLGWTPHPDRIDLFAELAHPAFMEMDVSASGGSGFTLPEAVREGYAS